MLDKVIKCKENFRRDIIVLSLVYFLSQGFILVLTGTWWDEKTWFFSSRQQMWDVALQLGKPTSYFVFSFLMSIPEWWGRVLIFILYYLSVLGVYIIFNQIPFISSQDVMLMTSLYVIIPINDARVLLGVFPYSLGYFLFILGYSLLVLLRTKYEFKSCILRFIVLFIFFCSFTLNSNLVFYALVLLYLFWYLVDTRQIQIFYKFVDFIVIPFAYFIPKSVLFPAHGGYEGYNTVSLKKILRSILPTVIECFSALKNMFMLWGRYILIAMGCGFLIYVGYIVIRKSINTTSDDKNTDYLSMIYTMFLLLMGVGVLYLGIFPYKMMYQGNILTGVAGRSSILMGIGGAMIIYAMISMVPHRHGRIWICLLLIICGICHFNYFYLLYQQDYYRQMDITYELKANVDILSNTKNILYLTDYEPEIEATRFYSLNSNAVEAFGDQSHYIMNGVEDFAYLGNEELMNKFVYQGDYQMKDYQIGRSDEIEAIIYYHDGVGLFETLYLKCLEIIGHDKFEVVLYESNNLDIYLPGTVQYKTVYDSFFEY